MLSPKSIWEKNSSLNDAVYCFINNNLKTKYEIVNSTNAIRKHCIDYINEEINNGDELKLKRYIQDKNLKEDKFRPDIYLSNIKKISEEDKEFLDYLFSTKNSISHELDSRKNGKCLEDKKIKDYKNV